MKAVKKIKAKCYKVSTNVNGQIVVSTSVNGKARSVADFKRINGNRLESKQAVVKRLCDMLGIEY